MQNKSDKFDCLIALAAMKCLDEEEKALKETDVSAVKFDDSYYRKRSRAISKCKRRYTFKGAKRVAVRLAVAVLIMLALTCALIGCVPSWRKAIYDVIVKWYEDCFTVSYEEPDGRAKETSYYEATTTSTENIIVVPAQIEEIRKPRDLPEGTWEDLVLQNNTTISIDYYFNEQYLFSFTQCLLNANGNYVDNEDVNVTYIKINGNDATVVEYVNKKEIYIFWNDGEYSYHISSTECRLDSLVKYSESVK